MKSEEPDKVAKVKGLLKKLGELAEMLDDISRKMRMAAEKQKANLSAIKRPTKDTARLLSQLTEQLSAIDHTPFNELQISKAKELSKKLIESCTTDPKDRSHRMTFHEYVEFSSLDEFKKFRSLPAITKKDLKDCNWEDLMMSLYDKCQD